MLATTIEGTTDLEISKEQYGRACCLNRVKRIIKYKALLTIEPIHKFNIDWLVDDILTAKPDIVTIGADSKGHGLPEPTAAEVMELIDWLKKGGYKVILKENLKRII